MTGKTVPKRWRRDAKSGKLVVSLWFNVPARSYRSATVKFDLYWKGR